VQKPKKLKSKDSNADELKIMLKDCRFELVRKIKAFVA